MPSCIARSCFDTNYRYGLGFYLAFDTENEAKAMLKYIKSKFARAMLGILKITQDNTKDKWKYVPLQDFTVNSDIDWTQSVADIDRQLYQKYDLSPEEIAFIETHVREMD